MHYLNLNILIERCSGRDKAKEQCSCVSTVVSSKKNGLENNVKDSNLQGFLLPIGMFI